MVTKWLFISMECSRHVPQAPKHVYPTKDEYQLSKMITHFSSALLCLLYKGLAIGHKSGLLTHSFWGPSGASGRIGVYRPHIGTFALGSLPKQGLTNVKKELNAIH